MNLLKSSEILAANLIVTTELLSGTDFDNPLVMQFSDGMSIQFVLRESRAVLGVCVLFNRYGEYLMCVCRMYVQ